MSPKTVTITCDQCGKDLATTGNCVDYRIALKNESIPSWGGGAVTAMMIYPPLEQDHYFCSWRCLTEWMHTRMEACGGAGGPEVKAA